MTAGAFLLLAVSLLPQCRMASAQDNAARHIFDLTNQDRAAHGLTALIWDSTLARSAGRHASIMVTQPSLSHQYAGEPSLIERVNQAGAHVRVVAENIADGPDPSTIEQQWMLSPPHRKNILDQQLNHLGVATAEKGGQLYAVEDFSTAVQSLDSAQVEHQVGELLRQQGIASSGPVAEARKDCMIDSGSLGASHPRLVLRWETGDLNTLPAQLTQQIATGKFKTAAVGACPATRQQNQSFTTYRVAVLLY